MSRERHWVVVDANEAAASVAHRLGEVIAIDPATPGAFGAVHAALRAGALATLITDSPGLLPLIPGMNAIADALAPFCMHVAARGPGTGGPSTRGGHADVMACRGTGFALLASSSVQEAHDLAAVAHAATLRARVPFLHFFDGSRTARDRARIEELADDDLRALVSDDDVRAHRARALAAGDPAIPGEAPGPGSWYGACPRVVREAMDALCERTGRRYRLFDYRGHPRAERVMVLMGSGAATAAEEADELVARGERVGVITVRLLRPFSVPDFLAVLPPTVRALAVLDRTHEPGAVGEPLYEDVVSALNESHPADEERALVPRVVGGRYGFSSEELDPAMVKAVFDALAASRPRNHFTAGLVTQGGTP